MWSGNDARAAMTSHSPHSVDLPWRYTGSDPRYDVCTKISCQHIQHSLQQQLAAVSVQFDTAVDLARDDMDTIAVRAKTDEKKLMLLLEEAEQDLEAAKLDNDRIRTIAKDERREIQRLQAMCKGEARQQSELVVQAWSEHGSMQEKMVQNRTLWTETEARLRSELARFNLELQEETRRRTAVQCENDSLLEKLAQYEERLAGVLRHVQNLDASSQETRRDALESREKLAAAEAQLDINAEVMQNLKSSVHAKREYYGASMSMLDLFPTSLER
jgi:hypothetical protein